MGHVVKPNIVQVADGRVSKAAIKERKSWHVVQRLTETGPNLLSDLHCRKAACRIPAPRCHKDDLVGGLRTVHLFPRATTCVQRTGSFPVACSSCDDGRPVARSRG